MKLTDYMKDRLAVYLIAGGTWVLVLIFLAAFRVTVQAAVIVSVILWLGMFAAEAWGFTRKKSWYDKLENCLGELDKKYLLSEMVSDPDFLEGHILYEALQESNKSMCEHIAEYRRENKEFREYLELWVHEIKLPVASLQLMCHNDDGNSSNHTKYAEQIRRIDDYIENVLYYARSGNAERDYIIKPVSLKRTFADIAIRNREELLERGISLHTEGLDVNVMTDGKWLGFILGQLMGNSMKYDATEITVTAEDSPEKTVLHFRDNGCGIPAADLPNIFSKSFTGENGRTHRRSTGMGLYIVKKLCGKLGHSVSAGSVQGEFTEISITFGKNDLHDVV
ncbi:Signal transduction histidine kinase [Ruminococcus sp. YE71]|uniref:sensor histidine kinase n=1 Tax=unclassified Ruminococcus TaxID=2608920 RepID=UPI00087FF8B4|nr:MULTISPECIES: sensor histidine kinase [unclassified Ruminococcus]SDA20613.1 Signal transduction histidine kinase [Ruminococcus sp. YE78]SFW33926.1 Signal transduction histidine kinase [Ruminococcus sp. YE71]